MVLSFLETLELFLRRGWFQRSTTLGLQSVISLFVNSSLFDSITMGASAGGLISFYLGWELNSTFSMAACLSPGLIFRDEDYVVELKKTRIPENLKLAIVNGTDGFDSNLQHGVNECIAYLNEIDFPDDNLLYWVAEGGSHSAKSWAEQAKIIVKWMYPKNSE